MAEEWDPMEYQRGPQQNEFAAEVLQLRERRKQMVRGGIALRTAGSKECAKQWRFLTVNVTCWRSAKAQVEVCQQDHGRSPD
eukprot:2449244-Amphidinium_carterae.2